MAGPQKFFRKSIPAYKCADLFLVAVEHQRRAPARFADALLGGLAPARMIHVRIHVGVKAVFIRRILAPRRARLVGHQLDFDDGFDALETVFPRHDQPDGRAILRRQCAAINPAGQNRQRMHRLVHPQTLDVRPVQHVAALAGHPLGIEQRLERDIFCAAQSARPRRAVWTAKIPPTESPWTTPRRSASGKCAPPAD